MRMDTVVWARFQSKGKPHMTQTINGNVRQVILGFAKWIGEVHMGTHLDIRIARTEAELDKTKDAVDADMVAELEALLADSSESN